MPAISPTIPVRYSSLLYAWLQDAYPDQATVSAAGLASDLLAQSDASMTLAELHALLKETERISGRHDLGFEIGMRIDFSSHGVLGRALQACATLDQAMRMASRYSQPDRAFFCDRLQARGRSCRTDISPSRPHDAGSDALHV